MSIFYKIFSGLNDAAADTVSNASYAVVRNATTSAQLSADPAQVGQRFATTYTVGQYIGLFDTSTLPAGAGTATLTLNCTVAATSAGTDVFEIREVTSHLNKIAGDSLAGFPLFGTMAIATSSGTKTSNTFSDITALSRVAVCRLLVHSANERLNIAPTENNKPQYNTANQTGTTNDPYFQVLVGTAWEHVATGTSVQSVATSHILTEPAGVAAGDLLVACIGSRIASTTSITLPAGWTLVGEAKNNNTLATTAALPSGMMAYIIRGASAPALTFTHPVAPNVALGRIVAYRNVHQATPLDTGVTQATTATVITAVSVAGLTTTADDDLIVALTAGGQEGTWSAFNATDPGTGSGTTADSVLDPVWGQWLERAEQITTTGNDTSLAVFDAVKQTAGATGNLVATTTLQAGHVVIAGSFKLEVAVPPDTPRFRSLTSTTYISRTNTVLTPPAGLADGDILIADILVGRNSSTLAVTAPAGFTEIGTPVEVTDASGFRGMLHVYWKRAASESGSYTFTHGAQNSQGLLKAYSDCLASGSPIGATSINNGLGTSAVGTGITTTAAKSVLLFEAHNWEGTGTLSPPAGMYERFDGVVYSADEWATTTTAGATGNRNQTTVNVSTDPWTIRMVELLAFQPVSGATGTLAATLDELTLAGTGEVTTPERTGTLAATLDALTLAGVGTVPPMVSTGTLATTLDAATLAATGTVVNQVYTGTLTTTLGALTAAGTGKVIVSGTASVTLEAATLAATGKVLVQGTLGTTLDAVTLAATGTGVTLATGTLAVTLAPLTLAATGTVVWPTSTGTLLATLGTLTLAGVGKVPVQGSLTSTLGALGLAGTGTVANTVFAGTLAATLGPATLAGVGAIPSRGTATITLGALTAAGTGTVVSPPRTATLAATLGALTLTSAGAVTTPARIGTLNVTLNPAVLVASSSPVSVGGLSATLGPVTLAAAGTVVYPTLTGTLAATLGPLALSGTGKVPAQATLGATLGEVLLAATGKLPARGTLATTLGPLQVEAQGSIPAQAQAAITLGALTLLAEGRSGQLPEAETIDLIGVIDSTETLTGRFARASGFIGTLSGPATLQGKLDKPTTLIGRRLTNVSL